WTNANRVNHANQFVPRSVQLNAGRPKFNYVRPNINTGRTNINSGRPKVNSVRPKVNAVSPKVNTGILTFSQYHKHVISNTRNVVLSDSEEEEPEAQGRRSQNDPLDSLVQGLVTPSTTKVDASGEEQVEYISPNTLEATKTLSRVSSLKPKSIDKGMRYKRRKETKGKKVVSSLDFQEEVDTGAKQVNTAEGVC
ncbi:hypothetical protein Tco_0130082, partial [Tanacetum coccineum]